MANSCVIVGSWTQLVQSQAGGGDASSSSASKYVAARKTQRSEYRSIPLRGGGEHVVGTVGVRALVEKAEDGDSASEATVVRHVATQLRRCACRCHGEDAWCA